AQHGNGHKVAFERGPLRRFERRLYGERACRQLPCRFDDENLRQGAGQGAEAFRWRRGIAQASHDLGGKRVFQNGQRHQRVSLSGTWVLGDWFCSLFPVPCSLAGGSVGFPLAVIKPAIASIKRAVTSSRGRVDGKVIGVPNAMVSGTRLMDLR